jgi:hypothetical protein
MGCFTDYYNAVSGRAYWTVMQDLDSAVSLVGCVHRGIKGSGPLYHGLGSKEEFTEAEKKQAQSLADRTRELSKSSAGPETGKFHAALADDAHDFAVACLVRRGAVHKGPPKQPVD